MNGGSFHLQGGAIDKAWVTCVPFAGCGTAIESTQEAIVSIDEPPTAASTAILSECPYGPMGAVRQ